jgi:MOSC domain-containing protein YiiM
MYEGRMMATLIGIAIRPPKSRDIRELDMVDMTEAEGIIGDKRSRPGKRQVTLMSQAAWNDCCRALGSRLPWTTRRANLLVDELPLEESTGKYILLASAVLEITGETDPCRLMEEAHPGLEEALKPNWRGGVTCRVIKGGALKIGMEASLENKQP